MAVRAAGVLTKRPLLPPQVRMATLGSKALLRRALRASATAQRRGYATRVILGIERYVNFLHFVLT